MTLEYKILDHGYIKLCEAWGHGGNEVDPTDLEAGIICAARQSTQGSFRGWEQDEKLLNFLYSGKPQHATPFEFCGMVIEVQAPIFVFREWHRHRTQSYNEMSARYAPLPDLNYKPTPERCLTVSATNKQAGAVKGSLEATPEIVERWLKRLQYAYEVTENVYQEGLAWGIPKELARLPVPVGRYSRMRASANLRNWLAFVTLRSDPAAQYEIRQYSYALGDIIAQRFPRTWKLYIENGGAYRE